MKPVPTFGITKIGRPSLIASKGQQLCDERTRSDLHVRQFGQEGPVAPICDAIYSRRGRVRLVLVDAGPGGRGKLALGEPDQRDEIGLAGSVLT